MLRYIEMIAIRSGDHGRTNSARSLQKHVAVHMVLREYPGVVDFTENDS